jgi:hypothetical protein
MKTKLVRNVAAALALGAGSCMWMGVAQADEQTNADVQSACADLP